MASAATDIREAVSTASRGLAIAVVVAAPLPFGSIDQPWPALWSGLMGVSLMSADPVRVPPRVRHALVLLAGLAAAWIAVLLVQGGPAASLGVESAWPRIGGPDAADPGPPASGSRQNPFLAAGPALLMALTFARFALLAAERGGSERTFRALRLAAVAIGCVSVLLFVVDPGRLLGRTKIYYLGSFTGTFVNRNTAAAFFGTACLLWACHLRGLVRDGFFAWRGTLVGTVLRVTDRLDGRIMGSVLATVLCLGWTAMTGSRAGFLLTSALLLPVLAAPTGRVPRRPSLVATAVVAAVLGILVLMLGGGVEARISAGGLFDPYRLEVYRLCLRAIGEHPWLGIGLGNFETVFPTWRTPAMTMRGQWEFAHSTPLELAVEVGIPLALATGLAWLAVGIRIARADPPLRRWRVRRPALAVLVFGMAHSLVDFPLQVPGYAIVFAAVVGCGFAGSSRSRNLPIGNTRATNWTN